MIEPLVFIIVAVFNRNYLTMRFIASIKNIAYNNYRVVIVDDGSTDDTEATIRAIYDDILILKGDGTLWWSGSTNLGIRYAIENGAKYILTINNDSIVDRNILTNLVDSASKNKKAIIGARIMFMNDPQKIWAMGSHFSATALPILRLSRSGEIFNQAEEKKETSTARMVCGNGTLIPAECFTEVGFYNAREFPQYHADSEYCLRASQFGYRVLVSHQAVVYNDTENIGANSKSSLGYKLFSRRSRLFVVNNLYLAKYMTNDTFLRTILKTRIILKYIEYVALYYPKKTYRLIKHALRNRRIKS